MNTKIYTLVFVALVAFLIGACTKMNDLHQKYLDEGEITYTSQLDSIAFAPGFGRVELELYNTNSRIENIRVYRDNGHDSIDVAIGGQVGIFKEIIPGLDEGESIFNIVCFDKFGNKSLVKEMVVTAFGEGYASGLLNRNIDNIFIEGNDVVINWRSVTGGSITVGTQFTYENNEGSTSELYIGSEENVTRISNSKVMGEYWYKTDYKPTANAIDSFTTTTKQGVFPKFETMFDKAKFASLDLPGDEPVGWGWVVSNLWDGVVGNQGYHSPEDGTMPKVLSIDMGVSANIGKIKLYQRHGYFYSHGNPKVFEIWGAESYDPSGSWDGWTKLMDCTSVKPSGLPGEEFNEVDDAFAAAGEEFINSNYDTKVRYIRIKVLESWSGRPIFVLSELEVFGDNR